MLQPSRQGRYIAIYPPLLFAAWVVAWLIDLWLRAYFQWDTQTDTVYWIAMKVIVWVSPVFVVILTVEHANIAEFLDLRHPAQGVRWGLSVGAVLVAVNYLGKTLPSGATLHMPSVTLPFLNAVIVAPIVEEITLRGFVQKRLELNGHPFWTANFLTTIVFVTMHIPGWLFNGRVASPVGLLAPMIPIALLSLLFGWTKKRADSLYASIMVHAINNLYSAF